MHKLEPGDLLVMLTDGLVEARSIELQDQLFGEERMRECLARHASTTTDARTIVELVIADVLSFAGGKREDDMTLLVVRRTGT